MATITTTPEKKPPHVALFPCAGMGHLIPFLRLAALLSSNGCAVTIITVHPTVSAAESDHLSTFFTTHPNIKRLEFQLIPHKKSKFTNEDPFFIQIETIANSVHLLYPLLSSSSPSISAIIADFPITSNITQIASDLSIPAYTLITTSATFFSIMTHLPQLAKENSTNNEANLKNCEINVPGLGTVPVSSIPPPMLDPNHFFSANISSNVSSLNKLKGVFINTFNWFEPEAIQALIQNPNLTRILPIGPFDDFATKQNPNLNLPWLDNQAPKSVVFVSFGSRTALSKDQIRELGNGLEKSGQKFIWVLKGSKVDKEDKEGAEELLGESFIERTKGRGVVIKGWVDQEGVLAHSAIGGFVSHCGWNSVTEAARLGVPILAWPQHGDQRVNAGVVEKAGLGVWGVRGWGWGGERLVGGDEIGDKIRELMVGEKLRERATEVKMKAIEAVEINGSSETLIRGLIEELKSNED